jgi:hypothetical protein
MFSDLERRTRKGLCMFSDLERRTRKGLLTSNDDCAVFSNRVTSTEGVGGEMEGGESLAGNVIDGTYLCLAITELQRMHAHVSRSGKGKERKGKERKGKERKGNTDKEEKAMTFGVNLMRSQVLYQATQGSAGLPSETEMCFDSDCPMEETC